MVTEWPLLAGLGDPHTSTYPCLLAHPAWAHRKCPSQGFLSLGTVGHLGDGHVQLEEGGKGDQE